MAELPDLYNEGEFDLVGFVVGVVERRMMLDGSGIREGDLVYGFHSNGLHTNGYTLARKIVFEHKRWNAGEYFAELGMTIGEALLTPHRLYLPIIRQLRAKTGIKGFAHITGGGIVGNLKRIFPCGLTFKVNSSAWEIPVLFKLLQEAGNVDRAEMFRVFNMGIGLVCVIDRKAAEVIRGEIPSLQSDG
jgi:phosphoribosylformylglycinamidine cyclo-ligase